MTSILADVAPRGGSLANLAHGMAELTKELGDHHHRISLQQALFFTVLAAANSHDANIRLKDVRSLTTDDENDVRLFGASVIGRGYGVFLKETGGLGWLKQIVTRHDRRQKYLRLTPMGKAVANRIMQAMQ